MDRRTVLRLGLAGAAGLAGCSTGPTSGGGTTPGGVPGGGGDAASSATADDRYPVPESALRRGAGEDAIPAIVDPAFGDDWAGLTVEVRVRTGTRVIAPTLTDEDRVVGLVRDGRARAYPFRVLNWHEVVNDSLGGPLLVTYCPLCRTSLAAVRRVRGEETVFGVSGLLYRSNLVMDDELTGSLWSQLEATAIRGELAGTRLELVPSTVTSWGAWTDVHPDTEVLLPPPESSTVRGPDAARDYTRDPYAGYDASARVGVGREEYDDRMHPKTVVVGVAHGGTATAYPLPAVTDAGVVNDRVGGLAVVVTTDAGGELVAYDRRVDGEARTFEAAGESSLRAAGSRWRPTDGAALDGPHEGSTLERANERPPMFWFSWADLHPDTGVYGG